MAEIGDVIERHLKMIGLIPTEELDEHRKQFVEQKRREAEARAARLGIEERVVLLPGLSPEQMGALFRRSQLSVSPSEHDGTPNTLLEAMACGSFPLAGDLESIREWIEPGVNGLLFDPANPDSLAQEMLRALADEPLRTAAAQFNQRLIAERGTYEMGMAKAERLYERLIHSRPEAAML